MCSTEDSEVRRFRHVMRPRTASRFSFVSLRCQATPRNGKPFDARFLMTLTEHVIPLAATSNSNRNLPIFELAFAKKNEQKNLPVVRLVTLWLGES
jgi:hypothetical protein